MSIDKLIAEGYQPINVFEERTVAELQIRLTQAQAVIAIQEQLYERNEKQFYLMRLAMLEVGASIDFREFERLGL